MGPDIFDDPSVTDVGSFDSSFDSVLAVGITLFVVVAVISIVVSVRRAYKLRQAGIDPIDPQADLAIRLARSQAFAPAPTATPAAAEKSIAERLAEVDALHAAGAIDDAERAAARARLLEQL